MLELFLFLILTVATFVFIKYLFKKFLFFIFIVIFSGIFALIYKVPYSVSTFSICILLYSIKCIFSEIIYMGGTIIKPCKFYLNGFYEKIVTLLFSLNYIIFMTICYMLLISKSFYILEILDLVIPFCLTWLCIWCIGYIRNIFLNYINTSQYQI